MGKLLKLGLSLGLPLATIVGVGIPTAVIHAKNVNIELENEAFDQDMQDSLLAELESGIWGDDVKLTNVPKTKKVDATTGKPVKDEKGNEVWEYADTSYAVEFHDLEINYWIDSANTFSVVRDAFKLGSSDAELLSQLGLGKIQDPNIMWSYEGFTSIVDNELKETEEERAAAATDATDKEINEDYFTFESIILSATREYKIYNENDEVISEYSKTIYIAVKFKD